MITIVKDGEKIRCSQNTYDTMYKRLGYEILVENKKAKVEKQESSPLEEVELIMPKETEEKKTTRTRTRTKKGE